MIVATAALASLSCGGAVPEHSGPVAVGTVVAFAGAQVPDGWLPADGRALARAAWPDLFAVLDTSHGSGVSPLGEKVGDFNLPDYRGRFLRGLDLLVAGEASGADPDATRRLPARAGRGNRGNRVGSYQADATAFPRDPGQPFRVSPAIPLLASGMAGEAFSGSTVGQRGSLALTRASPSAHEHRITGGDAETRPKNVSVQWIVRARP